MLQAPMFECLSLDPFSSFDDGGSPAEVGIGGRDVVEALVVALVYVNTRMLQTVLVEPKWAGRMTPEDYRGLTPLIYSHVNPYGRFDLDLNDRIDFGRLAA